MFSCLFSKDSKLEWRIDGTPKLPDTKEHPQDALRVLTALLHKDPRKRPTAAQALALPFFANHAAGLVAAALQKEVDVMAWKGKQEQEIRLLGAETAREQHGIRQARQALEAEAARISKAEEDAAQANQRKLEKDQVEIAKQRSKLEQQGGALKEAAQQAALHRDQSLKELGNQSRREKADLAAHREKSQQDIKKRRHALQQERDQLDLKERAIATAQDQQRRDEARLLKNKARYDAGIAPVPSHWTVADPKVKMPRQYLLHSVTCDRALFTALQECLAVEHPQYLGHGRDQRRGGQYTRLELQRAWRVENPALWSTYQGARSQVHGHAEGDRSIQTAMKNRIRVRKALYDASSKLPLKLDACVNEVFLLHGTAPQTLNILFRDGVNDKFSGGLFSHGTYLAEDAQKNDQYVTVDASYNAAGMKEMHAKMYSKSHSHPGEVFYIVVCRVTLGYPLSTKDALTNTQDGASLWHPKAKVNGSQLNVIPGTDVCAHSLVAETGQKILRNREFMIYNKSQVYPEYLLAYKRK